MSGESIVRFLMIEVLLACVMLLAAWGVSKLPWETYPKQMATIIVYVLFGGLMLIVLLRFVGIV